MEKNNLISKINLGVFDAQFQLLYGSSPNVIEKQKERYIEAIANFSELYPQQNDIYIFSAPGRTEIGGNHTDHQNGCILAAAVNLDVIAVVAFHHDGIIRLKSKGYEPDIVDIAKLDCNSSEYGSSAAIIRGMVARFSEYGIKSDGFDAYTTSDVLSGSGLSSSAAFEVLIGTIIDSQYNNGNIGAVEIAKISQYAENVYFGKASGLMDQMVCSVGGFVNIDFLNPKQPKIKKQVFDFEKSGYSLCITDTKGNHTDLTSDYVSVPTEMKHIAAQFNKTVLREVDENEFYEMIPTLRNSCSDREILRAAHFFAENKRANQEAEALSNNNMPQFLKLVRESGDSSANLLQNLYSVQKLPAQEIPLAIMLSKRIIGDNGAVRVHGGGFAGTIQAFVPNDCKNRYVTEMNRIFGDESCHILQIRELGGVDFLALCSDLNKEH